MARRIGRGSQLLHWLDKFVGVPIVVLLAIVNIFSFRSVRKRLSIDELNKICLLKTAAIGDTVLMLAVVKSIKAAFPNAEITFYCGFEQQSISKS